MGLLNIISRPGKCKFEFTILEERRPPGVVKVEVSEDDVADIGSGTTVERERPLQIEGGIVEPVDVRLLLREFRTVAVINENRLPPADNQKGAGGELDSVSLIGRNELGPERFGHDAEHRAPIQTETPRLNCVQLIPSYFHTVTAGSVRARRRRY